MELMDNISDFGNLRKLFQVKDKNFLHRKSIDICLPLYMIEEEREHLFDICQVEIGSRKKNILQFYKRKMYKEYYLVEFITTVSLEVYLFSES